MRIGINARLLYAKEVRGWNRYTVNLAEALAHLGNQVFLYSERSIHSTHLTRLGGHRFQVRESGLTPYGLWEQIWLPRALRRDNVDIYHCPIHFGVPAVKVCPRVITLHDAIDVAFTSRGKTDPQPLAALKSKIYQWIGRTAADHIITVSNFSASDLHKHYSVKKESITVIHEGVDSEFQHPPPEVLLDVCRKKYGLSRPYVLYVGGFETRKNVPWLIETFAKWPYTEYDLVMVGNYEFQHRDLESMRQRFNLGSRMKLLGFVGEAELPAIYRMAHCFIFPSRYEGFGLPPLEAMAMGCPTLVANQTSLPEVVGDGGIVFSLDDPSELIGFLDRSVREPEFRRSLSAQAKRRASCFSWQSAAEKTQDVYKSILGDAKKASGRS